MVKFTWLYYLLSNSSYDPHMLTLNILILRLLVYHHMLIGKNMDVEVSRYLYPKKPIERLETKLGAKELSSTTTS